MHGKELTRLRAPRPRALQKPGKFSVMDLGFAADAQAALDSAGPDAAGATVAMRPSSLPPPVDRLMSLIFDIEMMHQVSPAAGRLRSSPYLPLACGSLCNRQTTGNADSCAPAPSPSCAAGLWALTQGRWRVVERKAPFAFTGRCMGAHLVLGVFIVLGLPEVLALKGLFDTDSP